MDTSTRYKLLAAGLISGVLALLGGLLDFQWVRNAALVGLFLILFILPWVVIGGKEAWKDKHR